MPEAIASVVQLDDVFLVLIDFLLRAFVLELELVRAFEEFAQLFDHGREVCVGRQVAAQVGHVGDVMGISGDGGW